jgi:hypothetical protein
MDFATSDSEIGQELTEGEAFGDVAPRLYFLTYCARLMEIPFLKENRQPKFEAMFPLALAESFRWILPLRIPKSAKN